MVADHRPAPSPAVRRPTLEDRLLKFIEGHNTHIWSAIAVLAVVVILTQ